MLPLPEVQVRSLVRELRFCMPHSMAKKVESALQKWEDLNPILRSPTQALSSVFISLSSQSPLNPQPLPWPQLPSKLMPSNLPFQPGIQLSLKPYMQPPLLHTARQKDGRSWSWMIPVLTLIRYRTTSEVFNLSNTWFLSSIKWR